MNLDATLDWFKYVNLGLALILVWRLLQTRLYLPYRFFFIYQAYDALESILGLYQLDPRSGLYRYVALQSIKWILTALVVLEIYRLSLEKSPAIAEAGRRAVLYFYAFCVMASMTWVYFTDASPKEWLRTYSLAIERSLTVADLLFLGGLSLFLTRFPIRLRKNLVAYVLGFVAYFVSKGIFDSFGVISRDARAKQITNVALYAITLVILAFWIRAMRKTGEAETTEMRPQRTAVESERLREQLDEINTTLERLLK